MAGGSGEKHGGAVAGIAAGAGRWGSGCVAAGIKQTCLFSNFSLVLGHETTVGPGQHREHRLPAIL